MAPITPERCRRPNANRRAADAPTGRLIPSAVELVEMGETSGEAMCGACGNDVPIVDFAFRKVRGKIHRDHRCIMCKREHDRIKRAHREAEAKGVSQEEWRSMFKLSLVRDDRGRPLELACPLGVYLASFRGGRAMKYPE